VISPHFDDAVLSCAHWLQRHPGATVATICSGSPGGDVEAHQWDEISGFVTGDEAAIGRRAEDAAALTTLCATQLLCGFLDGGYKELVGRCHEDPETPGPFEDALAIAITELVDHLRPTLCVAPLGLIHGDHIATGRASRSALSDRSDCSLLAYADLPYAITAPERLQSSLADLRASGLHVAPYPTPSPTPVEVKKKEQALACYGSQIRPLTVEHPRWRAGLQPQAEMLFQIRS